MVLESRTGCIGWYSWYGLVDVKRECALWMALDGDIQHGNFRGVDVSEEGACAIFLYGGQRVLRFEMVSRLWNVARVFKTLATENF